RDEIIAALFPTATRAIANTPPAPSTFAPPAALCGQWKGTVHTWKADLSLTLEIKADGDIHAQLGTQLTMLLNRAAFQNGYLTGVMNGDIGTEDANRTKYTLNLSLKLRGDILNGGITALSLPGKRVGNALTHWVELKKQ
ncbi:MAG TPA: hypothetical protein PKD31_11300, partial [Blastocatellia bacterium]|nr:hypothetical protein [Blastocatellia bacterium]